MVNLCMLDMAAVSYNDVSQTYLKIQNDIGNSRRDLKIISNFCYL